MRTLIAGFVIAALFSTVCRGADDLPRYKLPVGRVLKYEFESKAKGPDGKTKRDSSGNTRLIVVGQNAEGSSRVVVEQAFNYGEGSEHKSIAMFDVQADGTATPVGG